MPVSLKPRTHHKALDGTTKVNNVKNRAGLRQWQIDHIRRGLLEAKAGKFAAEVEVNRVISRLRVR